MSEQIPNAQPVLTPPAPSPAPSAPPAGSQPGLVEGEPGGALQAGAAPADLTALQAQLAASTARQTEQDRLIASQGAAIAASAMRERRGELIAELRERIGSGGRVLPPAWAERAADLLLRVPETALTAANADGTQRQTTPQREDFEFLATVFGQATPLIGELGANMQPRANLTGAGPGEKRTELHRLVLEAQAKNKDLEYEAACTAVLAERKDLA